MQKQPPHSRCKKILKHTRSGREAIPGATLKKTPVTLKKTTGKHCRTFRVSSKSKHLLDDTSDRPNYGPLRLTSEKHENQAAHAATRERPTRTPGTHQKICSLLERNLTKLCSLLERNLPNYAALGGRSRSCTAKLCRPRVAGRLG